MGKIKRPLFTLSLCALLLTLIGTQHSVQAQAEEVAIQVPLGFSVSVWAPNAGITAMTFDSSGRMFATSTVGGTVWILEDVDHDGFAEVRRSFAEGFEVPLGLTFVSGNLYVASRGKISRLRDTDGDDTADIIEDVVTHLPTGEKGADQEIHQTNGLALGPDGLIYVSQGAVGNAEPEIQPWAGTIFTLDPNTGKTELFAEGFRNPYALIFDSQNRLFATDNGADGLTKRGLETDPPDELNWIRQGGHYGHPYYFDNVPSGLDPVPPVADFGPHASADGLDDWLKGDIFVVLFSKKEIVRVMLDWQDDHLAGTSVKIFAHGFRSPLAIKTSLNGKSLFVSDYLSGPIYVEECSNAARMEPAIQSGKVTGWLAVSMLVLGLLALGGITYRRARNTKRFFSVATSSQYPPDSVLEEHSKIEVK